MNLIFLQNAVAGFFPGRNETALDVSLHIEQVFDKAYFEQAFTQIFEELGPAKAMFDAAGQSANVAELLNSAKSIVAFDLSFSTGIKVENALSVFSGSAAASSSLFFRLETLGVFAEASMDDVSVILFPRVDVEGGNFLLSAGLRIAAPFEAAISLSGSLANGIAFGNELTALIFKPYGQLMATLPFNATINGLNQKLRIKFEDDNVFDTQQLLVKVDLPVCPILNVMDSLLGKLGSMGFSPKAVLGPVGLLGVDISDTLDEYFPDVSQFIDGILGVSSTFDCYVTCSFAFSPVVLAQCLTFPTSQNDPMTYDPPPTYY
jgi:hypothetical protein